MKTPPKPRRDSEPKQPDTDRTAGQAERERQHARERRRVGPRTVIRRPISADAASKLMGPGEDSAEASLDDRLHERRSARIRLLVGRIVAAVVTCVVVGVAGWLVFFSPLFALQVQQIHVTGADGDMVDQQEVVRAITPWYGTPLPRLSMEKVEQSVEEITRVKDAQVTRKFPAGLDVVVTPRQIAMSQATDTGWNLMDDEGVILREEAVPAAEKPIVDIPDDMEDPLERAQIAADVLEVWAALGGDLQQRVATVSSDGLLISLTLNSGARVHWGAAGDTDLKAKVLATLVANREASAYDVSSPTHPVVS